LIKICFQSTGSIWWGHRTDFSSHLSASPSCCIDPPLVLVLRCAWHCVFQFYWTTV